MKSLSRIIIAVLLATVLIIAAGIFIDRFIHTSSESLDKQIMLLENSARLGNWKEAKAALERIEKEWVKTSRLWATLIDHNEIDNIEIRISKISTYVDYRDTSRAIAEISALRQNLKHISRKESFRIENIF